LMTFIALTAAMAAASPPTDRPIGFIGVGVMNSAIVRGLCTLDSPPSAIVLSPRNAALAASLHAQWPSRVSVGTSNQQVVDACDLLFLGVLPKHYEEVCTAIRFRPDHLVVSLVSTAPLAKLREICAPATVVRAIPLPPVATHRGATIMCPPHERVTPLFESLGTCVAVEDEEMMKKMMPVTALMGQLYAQQLATQHWLEAQGVDTSSAAKWTGAVYHCVTSDSARPLPHTFQHLVDEQTKGGLNEQVIREMREAGAYAALSDSLDGCLARIQGRTAAKKRKNPYSSALED